VARTPWSHRDFLFIKTAIDIESYQSYSAIIFRRLPTERFLLIRWSIAYISHTYLIYLLSPRSLLLSLSLVLHRARECGTSRGSLTRARLHAGDRRRDRAARNTARNKVRNWPHASKCARARMQHKSLSSNSCSNVLGQKSPWIKSYRHSGTHSEIYREQNAFRNL